MTQRIVWPWETKKWNINKNKIVEPCHSIIEMDSRICSMYVGKLHPRQIAETFNSCVTAGSISNETQTYFITNVIPWMQTLVEGAPKLFRSYDARLLIPSVATNIVFSRLQAATILTCVWFGLFEYNYISKGVYKEENFPGLSFINIFTSQNIFGTACLVNYFIRVYQYCNVSENSENSENNFETSNIIIKRSVFNQSIDWVNSEEPITEIYLGEGFSDDAPAKMHIVYAHEFIGGLDLFKNSLTQEEIILLTRPECLISLLITARIDENESVTVIGAEKVSQYTGYGSSVKFAGNIIDKSPIGSKSRPTEHLIQCASVFIDASNKTSGKAQFIDDFQRDLEKAYCGFSSLTTKTNIQISSGHWTYGFNGNNMQIKFLQQVLAASQSGKDLIYHPFSGEFESELIPFVDWIKRNDFTVGDLFTIYLQMLDQFGGPKSRLSDLDVFSCMRDV